MAAVIPSDGRHDMASSDGVREIPTEEAEIIIAKHRNGPAGTVRVGFQAGFARFVNLARYERDDEV